MLTRIRQISLLSLACIVVGCTSPAVASRAPDPAGAPTPTPTETRAPSSTPSTSPERTRNPPPTPVPTIPSTAEVATEAPAGALTIETFSDQVYFTPLNVTATSGKVALFVTNTRAGAEFSRLAHNLKLGPGVGEALTGTPALVPGAAVLLTIDDLAPGEYAFWCTVDEHYKAGMVGTLTVTP